MGLIDLDMMNSTLIDFNTYKHSILVMFVIGFMVGGCVEAQLEMFTLNALLEMFLIT